ncbi:MAG: HAMP domain-containing histidine kinase [Bacteroidales bacterium]|jgi:signal transduction histidine kinase|nr:HAMP domain-containing histidine kinase [Bacteroidales bacterium]
MKIQTRLVLLSSLLWGVVFIIVGVLIYGVYRKSVENSMYQNLEKTARITALFFFEEDELNEDEFAKVRKQYEEVLSDYIIYDNDNIITHGDGMFSIPVKLLDGIRSKGKMAFLMNGFLCYGIYYEDNQGNFVVITKEKQEQLNNLIRPLVWILLSAFIIGMLATLILNRWLARAAYYPIRKIIRQVKNISTDDLTVQLAIPDTKDELQLLTRTFNELLEKISDTFVIQKNFVSYISHEFKTPLASILGNLEVFSIRDRTPEEYHHLVGNLIDEIHQLEGILDTLLEVSGLRKDVEITDSLRVDELIWEIIDQLSARYSGLKTNVQMEIPPEDESILYLKKNKIQLFMALLNLIENAVKFSKGKTVDIRLYKEKGKLLLSITDKGIGIPKEQLSSINRPFYRAENSNQVQGSGIGLSIALRILEKNHIPYSIDSKENIGTKVILILQYI